MWTCLNDSTGLSARVPLAPEHDVDVHAVRRSPHGGNVTVVRCLAGKVIEAHLSPETHTVTGPLCRLRGGAFCPGEGVSPVKGTDTRRVSVLFAITTGEER